MKKEVQKIRKKRKYSEAFKKGLVKEYESGQFSVLELSRLYGIGYRLIYNWIYKYSIFNEKGYRIVESNQNSRQKLKQLERRVQELEGLVGQVTLDCEEPVSCTECKKDRVNVVDCVGGFICERCFTKKLGKVKKSRLCCTIC